MGEPDVPSRSDEAEDEEEPTRIWMGDGSEPADMGGVDRFRASGQPSVGLSEADLFDDIVDTGSLRSNAALPVDGSLGSLSGKHQPANVATVELDVAQVRQAVEGARNAASPRAHATCPQASKSSRLWKASLAVAIVALAGALYLFWVRVAT